MNIRQFTIIRGLPFLTFFLQNMGYNGIDEAKGFRMEAGVEYVVYLDVFWFVNFIADIYMLLCVRRWMNYRTKLIRCVPAAVFGAVSACVRLVKGGNSVIMAVFIYIFTAMLMCQIAFGFKKIIKNTLLLYFVSMIFGGISDFLYFQIGIKHTFIIFIIIALVSYEIITMLDSRKMLGNKKCEVELYKGDSKIVVTAIIDTGNSLREPYGNRPVHILEKTEAKELINDLDSALKLLIPFHSLGCDNGMIEGITVDRICIKKDGESIVEDNSVIGIYKGKLSGNGMYSMIINPESIEEREEYKGGYKGIGVK